LVARRSGTVVHAPAPLMTRLRGAGPERGTLHVRQGYVRPAGVGPADPDAGERLVIVLRIHELGQPQLLAVGEAGRGAGLLAGLGKNREKNSSQNLDNGDDYEQFDQGETFPRLHDRVLLECALLVSVSGY